jgi:hypothetical protein
MSVLAAFTLAAVCLAVDLNVDIGIDVASPAGEDVKQAGSN